MVIYNIGILLYGAIIALVSLWNPKARYWVDGRKQIFKRMKQAFDSNEKGDGEVVWIHAASLGEFEQGRPIIERLRKEKPSAKILLTFFSPSGYEVRKNYDGADYIFYLPLDTPSNVRRFLDITKPSKAIFVKYEYWLNMLFELHRRSIDSYVVSANFRLDSIFFKPWGGLHRKAIRTFKTIFVQTQNSKELLSSIGIDNVVVAGDTRFDRVVDIAKNVTPVERIEAFAKGEKLFVAGSTWPADIEIIIPLIKSQSSTKFLIVPHEVDDAHMLTLKQSFADAGVEFELYTTPSAGGDARVLVVDTIGVLSRAYQYALCAYIGGGFGVGIHNTLEAAVYGVPVVFGPNYHKFTEAVELISRGVACSVNNDRELGDFFSPLTQTTSHLEQVKAAANRYTEEQSGATQRIIDAIG